MTDKLVFTNCREDGCDGNTLADGLCMTHRLFMLQKEKFNTPGDKLRAKLNLIAAHHEQRETIDWLLKSVTERPDNK